MNGKILLTIFIAIIYIIGATRQTAHACSCLPPRPPAQAVAEADAVFMGQVISFELINNGQSRQAKIAVSKIWKGERRAVSEIFTAANSAACGYDFQAGETYLIYAYDGGDQKFYTHICSRTRPARHAADDLKYLALASNYPMALGNNWTFFLQRFQGKYQDNLKDSVRVNGKLYYRFERFREFNNVLLRLADDGKLFMRLDTTEQVWVDFGAKLGDEWPVIAPNKLARWTVQFQSTTDTVKTLAGTFTKCYRFHFRFPGADNSWDEWYAFNVGPVKRINYGIALFEYILESAILNGTSLPTSVEEENPTRAIHQFELLQNHPNPFANGVTVIRYRLIKAAPVMLSIYDVLGREIKTLIQRNQSPGEYAVSWDGTNKRGEKAPSGIYFYQIRAGNLTETKKIVLTP